MVSQYFDEPPFKGPAEQWNKCCFVNCQAQPQLQPQPQFWLRLVLFLDSSSHPPPPTPNRKSIFTPLRYQ